MGRIVKKRHFVGIKDCSAGKRNRIIGKCIPSFLLLLLITCLIATTDKVLAQQIGDIVQTPAEPRNQYFFNDELNEPSWVYRGRGDRYYREGEIGKAITQYKKALIKRRIEYDTDGNNGYPEVNLKLALLYKDEGLYDLALGQIQAAEDTTDQLQIPDMIFELLYLKAEIYRAKGNLKETIGVYNQIIEMDENWQIYANWNLSEIPDSVIKDLAGKRELRKKFGQAYFSVGEMKYRNNNYITAEPYLKMALLYNYESEKARAFLIEYYTISGKRAAIEKIMKLLVP